MRRAAIGTVWNEAEDFREENKKRVAINATRLSES